MGQFNCSLGKVWEVLKDRQEQEIKGPFFSNQKEELFLAKIAASGKASAIPGCEIFSEKQLQGKLRLFLAVKRVPKRKLWSNSFRESLGNSWLRSWKSCGEKSNVAKSSFCGKQRNNFDRRSAVLAVRREQRKAV